MPSKQLHNEVLRVVAKQQNTMALKDGTTSKSIARTSSLETAAAAGGCSSKKPTGRHLFRNTAETAKHHLISCRKGRKINRKNKFPGGRNVPSEILLEILSNPAIPYPAILLEIESNPIHPMSTAAASSHALKTAPQRSPSGRLRNSKTPWP